MYRHKLAGLTDDVYIDTINDLDNKPVDVKKPGFMKLAAILSRYKEDNYVKKELVSRILEQSIIEGVSTDDIDVLSIPKYKEYNDEYNYSDYQSFLEAFIIHKIGKHLNISFKEFMTMSVLECNKIIKFCRSFEENRPEVADVEILEELNKLLGGE